jgi:hypothetical protein
LAPGNNSAAVGTGNPAASGKEGTLHFKFLVVIDLMYIRGIVFNTGIYASLPESWAKRAAAF